MSWRRLPGSEDKVQELFRKHMYPPKDGDEGLFERQLEHQLVYFNWRFDEDLKVVFSGLGVFAVPVGQFCPQKEAFERIKQEFRKWAEEQTEKILPVIPIWKEERR